MKETIVPRIDVKKGSITTVQADAIVNPANSFGFMGGGVGKAIRDVGGKKIEDEAVESAPVQVGQAVATTGGDLVAKRVIHAPTMHNPGERTDSHKIACAVDAALDLADRLGCRVVAIPGMGTGIGGVGKPEAAKAMIGTIRKKKFFHVETIILVDIDQEMVSCFEKELRKKVS